MSEQSPHISNMLELGELLGKTVDAFVSAQEKLDTYTQRRAEEYQAAPEDSLAIPPLWYTFTNVAIEIELAAAVKEQTAVLDNGQSVKSQQFLCQALNPTQVSLYGYEASAGLRVRLQLGLRGVPPLKTTDE